MIVVGSVVGAGIFLIGGWVAQYVRSPAAFLGVWAAGGAFALAGALCNGELGAMFPRGGGDYVYLSRAYGPAVGFLSGWTSFWIGFPGSIASLAAGFGRGVMSLTGGGTRGENAVGLVAVLVLTLVNALAVSKLTAFVAVLAFGLLLHRGSGAAPSPATGEGEHASALALALVPIA